jgi:hypothetical protein
MYLDFRTQFTQIMDEVPSEAIVIVDEDDHVTGPVRLGLQSARLPLPRGIGLWPC